MSARCSATSWGTRTPTLPGASSSGLARVREERCGLGYRLDGTDYRTDLQRAVERLTQQGGGLLWLPPNETFTLPRPLSITAGGIIVAGGGPSTILRLHESVRGRAVVEIRSRGVVGLGPIGLQDLRVDGRGHPVYGVFVDRPPEALRLDRVTIRATAQTGIYISDNPRPVVLDSVVVESCHGGVFLLRSEAVSLIGCRVESSRSLALEAREARATRLTYCELADSARVGLSLFGVRGFSAVGCRFVDNGNRDGSPQIRADGRSMGVVLSASRIASRTEFAGPSGLLQRAALDILDARGTMVLGCSIGGHNPAINLGADARLTNILGDTFGGGALTVHPAAAASLRMGLNLNDPSEA